MKRKTLVLWTQAMVVCATIYVGQQSIQAQVAPGGPGGKADWLPSNKTGIGTSYTTASNVWFTLQDGRLSELYYPDLQHYKRPQPRFRRYRWAQFCGQGPGRLELHAAGGHE
jgi:hypothetical protein